LPDHEKPWRKQKKTTGRWATTTFWEEKLNLAGRGPRGNVEVGKKESEKTRRRQVVGVQKYVDH